MTPFEQAVKAKRQGELYTPKVFMGDKEIAYFGYQLSTHKFALSIMSKGMKMRGVKFTDIKTYYGLKSNSAKTAVTEFETLIQKYKTEEIC